MTRMLCLACLVLLIGCAQPKPQLVKVWGPGDSLDELPTPPGFKVTPQGAHRAVVESDRLSLKHNWACFRDDRAYYIFDTFGRRVTAENALRYGVRVGAGLGRVLDDPARD